MSTNYLIDNSCQAEPKKLPGQGALASDASATFGPVKHVDLNLKRLPIFQSAHRLIIDRPGRREAAAYHQTPPQRNAYLKCYRPQHLSIALKIPAFRQRKTPTSFHARGPEFAYGSVGWVSGDRDLPSLPVYELWGRLQRLQS